MTAEFDDNSLNTILSKANIVSAQTLKAKYPSGKIPRNSEDNGKTFVCRRGVTARTASYTDEFIWEDVFQGVHDLDSLRERIKTETQLTRVQKSTTTHRPNDMDDFIIVDDEDKENGPRTPKKRRRLDGDATPRSGMKKGTPSKFTTPTHKR